MTFLIVLNVLIGVIGVGVLLAILIQLFLEDNK